MEITKSFNRPSKVLQWNDNVNDHGLVKAR